MKKEIEDIDKKNGIVRVTTWDERVYMKPFIKPKTGLPEYRFVDSVTFITSFCPKGKWFMKWQSEVGYDNAIQKMVEAGVKGDKLHQGGEMIFKGLKVNQDTKFLNKETEEMEELAGDEFYALMTLVQWIDSQKKFEVIATEITGFNGDLFAGTVDLIARIDGQLWVIDLKTGLNIFPAHELQLSAYANLTLEDLKIGAKEWKEKKLAILQIGYTRNKTKHFKFTEVEEQFDTFLAVKKICDKEKDRNIIRQVEYPLEIYSEKLLKVKTNSK